MIEVYAFRNDTNVWYQLGNDIFGDSATDMLVHVALSANGTRLATSSAWGPRISTGLNGYVRVYNWNDELSTWRQVGGKIQGLAGENFGTSISLSSTGNLLVVGGTSRSANAGEEGHQQRGVVRAFELRAATT